VSEQLDTWAELRRKLPANLPRQAHAIGAINIISTNDAGELGSPVWRNAKRSSPSSILLGAEIVPPLSSAVIYPANDNESCCD
jgi:hypothetical protein